MSEIVTPREHGLLYGPDGREVSRQQADDARRKKDVAARKQCQRWECENERARKLPNGLRVCAACYGERLE